MADSAEAQAEAVVKRWRNEVDTSSKDDPTRPESMTRLACSLTDLYDERSDSDSGLRLLLEAAQIMRDAIRICSENNMSALYPISYFGYIFNPLYKATSDPTHLDEAIQAGRRAVTFEVSDPTYFARMSEHLARQLYNRFTSVKVGGDLKDLDEAIVHGTKASNASSFKSQDGGLRFSFLSDLLVEKALATDQIDIVDTIIEERTKLRAKAFEPDDEHDASEVRNAANANLIRLFITRCWRYGLSQDPEDLEEVIRITSLMLDENEEHRASLVRFAAEWFHNAQIKHASGSQTKMTAALKTVELLYRQLLNILPMVICSHLGPVHAAAVELRDINQQLWNQTGITKYGWEWDDLSMSCYRLELMIKKADTYTDDDPIASTFDGVGISHAESPILQKTIVKYYNLDDPLSTWPAFVEEISPKNYIRSRNDDGTVDLGFTNADEEISTWWSQHSFEESIPSAK